MLKKNIVFSFLFLIAVALIAYASLGVSGVDAQSSNAEQAQKPEVLDGHKEGVWRDGKAVFSDIELLDVFTPFARGYRPKQPIAFSHNIHVELNKMECQYCHSGVTKSPYATIPPVELCMGCHKNIKTESPEIQKLKEYYDKGESIAWEPVHRLPEHAVFNHARHIKSGVGCQKCHGQIGRMNVVEKVSSLKMGFCVSCHRDQGAPIDCATCHY